MAGEARSKKEEFGFQISNFKFQISNLRLEMSAAGGARPTKDGV
jgi:hypothetical protein